MLKGDEIKISENEEKDKIEIFNKINKVIKEKLIAPEENIKSESNSSFYEEIKESPENKILSNVFEYL